VSVPSIRTRLVIWYSFALAAGLTALAAAVLWQQSRIAMQRVDRELEAAGTTLANVIRDELTETADTVAAATEARATIGSASGAIAIFDSAGRPLAASWNRLVPPGAVPLDPAPHAWTVGSPPA